MKKQKKPRGIRKPKGYTPGSISKNLYIARYNHIPGNNLISGEAARFFDDCKMYFQLKRKSAKCVGQQFEVQSSGYHKPWMKALGISKKNVDEIPTTLGIDISDRLLLAIEKRDGYFFKDLARLCEYPEPENIGLRFWLIVMHWGVSNSIQDGHEQEHCFTTRELCKRAVERGAVKEISERDMHRICDELGIKCLRRKGWKKKLRQISN